MRSKTFCLLFSVLFAVSLFLGSDVQAKSSGRSSSSSRSSSSRSSTSRPTTQTPSKGYGNTATKPGQSSKPEGQGYGNTGTKSSAPSGSSPPAAGYGNSAQPRSGAAGLDQRSSSQPTPLQSRMNKSFSKQESAKAHEDYKAQQGKFKASSTAYNQSARESSTANSIRARAGYSSSSDYYSRRSVFYNSYGWAAPGYVYYSYPRFGIWDAMMLWFMLDHINDAQYAAMYYNHRDDPGMQQFRKELDRLSTENAELKTKVAKLDESAKTLEQQGVKPDPAYVPQDAASVALAADVAEKGEPPKSGFPWTWVIGIGLLALIVFLLKRRKD